MIDENGRYYEYENGVKVTYTNSDTNILHLNDDYDNGYDAKMKTPASGADGSLDFFTSSSKDWQTHLHGNVDSNGKITSYHDEDSRKWNERNHLLELLKELSLEELEIIERCQSEHLDEEINELLRKHTDGKENSHPKVLKFN